MSKKMKITLETISRESGFSVTTVSRALAGYDDVNETTRQHIIAIAKRLGYQPNLAARHLRSKQTQTVGMVIPLTAHFSDPFFMELLAGVGRQAAEYGYDLLLSAQQPGEEELNSYRRMVASSRIDGVVVARVWRDDPRITFLKEVHHPFVVFGRSNLDDYPYIDVDGTAGIHQLVRHLVMRGYRRIAIILSPLQLAFTSVRYEGYLQGLREAGLLLREEYDSMALGAMQAIQERGLVVGRDVAVAGFDDIPAAMQAVPPLTTVRQPIYDIGRRAFDMLIKVIRHEPLEESHVLLVPQLMVRESSGGME
jgi:LacI family transcriptional regulator